MTPSSSSAGHRSPLRVYEMLARVGRLGYGGKIMLVAFVGTHVPLLALLGWFLATSGGRERLLDPLGVALVATLAGTAMTLWLLHQLLRPIVLTADSLTRYARDRTLPVLPTEHHDTAGRLMRDADEALRRLDAALDELEHYDTVTGLGNRRRLMQALVERSADHEGGPFAVCALGIGGLDEIASAFGRDEADRVLRLVIRRLVTIVPAHEPLYRIGAATLAVVLDTADPETIGERLSRLDVGLQGLGGGLEHDLSCRRGVSLWPLDDRGPTALLDDALVALDVARRRGAPWAFYSEGSRRALVDRYRLVRELERALGRDELQLHFQPVIDAASGAIVGAEALLRWQHPVRGLLLPGRFVPLAEESGLIERLGYWTLDTACRQIRGWRERGVVAPCIAVNLSARQFTDAALPGRIAALVVEHGILPGSLEVELTETSAGGDVVHTGQVMAELRALGIALAIDDFGTGHSSLSNLRTMPFDKLKIDREFVQDIDSNADHLAICRALIALGRELQLTVLAEGTETAAEVATLRRHGCHLFQGYHFHRPLPVAAFSVLLAGGQRPVLAPSTAIVPAAG